MTEALSGGELVVRSLAAHGVELVFGIPGTHNLPLYAHLDATACGTSRRATSRAPGTPPTATRASPAGPGVVVTTAGPAVMNAAAAAGQAQSDSVPAARDRAGHAARAPERADAATCTRCATRRARCAASPATPCA